MMNADILSSPVDEPYTDNDHRRLDAQVVQYLAALWESQGHRAYLRSPFAVLHAVIETDSRLDPRRVHNSFRTFQEHPELETKLVDAWKAKSFRDIRSIGTSLTGDTYLLIKPFVT